LRDALRREPASHVVISAPWIPSVDLQALLAEQSSTCFAVNCHSNVGFLQADASGVRRVREAMEIEAGSHNFHLAGNSIKFCKWVHSAYFHPCTYLPNLYYLDSDFVPNPPLYRGGALRIGAFGATRPLKNFMSAAGAALEISRNLKADLELWLSAGRTEGGGDTILRAAQAMLEGVPNVRLVQNGWQSWPKFRQSVAHMHLLLQPSYTESFNMVTADGIAEGVPSVVSHAIDWAPDHWKAVCDDVLDIARVGRYLLSDCRAARDGLDALRAHNESGLTAWRAFLKF
jgi:glycosyltransferase involved in cell wall biosynthesis